MAPETRNPNAPKLSNPTWTPKVCKIITFIAIIINLGLLFYILLGFKIIAFMAVTLGLGLLIYILLGFR